MLDSLGRLSILLFKTTISCWNCSTMSLGLMFSSLKLYWTESWVGVGGIGGTRGRFLAWEGCVDMAGSCGNGGFVLGGNEESTIFFLLIENKTEATNAN